MVFIASAPAWADPVATPLQIRLQVVEGCADDTGHNRPCPVPRQRSDATALPAQVRALAPPATDADGQAAAEPLTTYY